MTKPIVKKLFYCPVKSLSFNESKSLKIIYNVGIKYDRFIAFTRGLDKKSAIKFNNSKNRNLNYFLTLKNSPYLKKYNFIFDTKKNSIELFLNSDRIIQARIDDINEINKVEKYIENIHKNIKKPVYFIHNNKLPFFDTTPNISISLINLNSVKDLEIKLKKKIEYERFRGNILIDNLKPWEEFNLINKNIKIGNVEFFVESKIPRCSATNINPKNYNLDINLPNKLIKLYGHKDLGIYLIPINSGSIKCNDKIIIN